MLTADAACAAVYKTSLDAKPCTDQPPCICRNSMPPFCSTTASTSITSSHVTHVSQELHMYLVAFCQITVPVKCQLHDRMFLLHMYMRISTSHVCTVSQGALQGSKPCTALQLEELWHKG